MKAIVVGGGPVGMAAALALARENAADEIVVLEAGDALDRPSGDRNLALSVASWRTLGALGVDLDGLPRAPIERVDVSQAGAFGYCRLEAADAGLPMLGAAVPYPDLLAALRAVAQRAEAAGALRVSYRTSAAAVEHQGARAAVQLVSGERLTADIVVLAEGAASARSLLDDFRVLTRDSGQVAVLGRVRAPRAPSPTLAVERFTPCGALALVPRVVPAGRAAEWTLIWARPRDEATRLLEADRETFIEEVNAHAGPALGPLAAAEVASEGSDQRSRYPLVWRLAEPRARGAVVAIGQAAQALHPAAAQGLNLGLADVRALARALTPRGAGGPTVAARLAAFARERAPDRIFRIGFSGVLAHGFDRGGWLLDAPRGFALTALQLFPPARRALVRRLATR